MNTVEHIKQSFFEYLSQQFPIATSLTSTIECTLNTDPQKTSFGDINTNAAMILAKPLATNPRALAQTITSQFNHPYIEKIEIAGPGFINFFLTAQAFKSIAKELYEQGDTYFRTPLHHTAYNIEFVSANPTGPFHLGHGRGGIIGDVLSNVLSFLGHTVNKEYYINDAGAQMNKLGLSLNVRCKQLSGQDIAMPEDGYQGEYLKDIAQSLLNEQGKSVLEKDIQFFIDYAYHTILKQQEETLQAYGITFNTWFSERSLYPEKVEQALFLMNKAGMTYEKDGALWFKSTHFGDDKDRVLKKTDGTYTYAASDAAYLLDKASRGYKYLIFVLGQDHDSYPKRLNGMRQALGLNDIQLDCILYQLVSIKEDGQQMKLSKRAGRIISLSDITQTVGTDIARFFYLNRKAEAHLDFDISLALSQTNENPVYYLHYAYVRTNSIIQKSQVHPELTNITIDDINSLTESEHLLIKKLASLKHLLITIQSNYQVHLVSYYLLEVAETFHNYYHHNRIIEPSSIGQSRGRLVMTLLVQQMFNRCLKLMNLSRPESM